MDLSRTLPWLAVGLLAGAVAVRGAGLARAQDEAAAEPRDERVLIGAVDFTTAEVEQILELSPLPPPPPDPTNRWYEDERAARLGQALFFDPRLSANGQVSCATCHEPAKSWTDGEKLGVGVETARRNTQSLWNVAHNRWFFWDGRRDTLWAQALTPLESPEEHAFSRLEVAHVIAGDADYRRAYEELFGPLPPLEDGTRFPPSGRPVFDDSEHGANWRAMSDDDRDAVNRVFAHVGKSIAAYERLLVTPEAPFDVYVRGLRERRPYEQRAISDSAKRGLRIFLGPGRCVLCHFGPNFTDLEFHDQRLATVDPPASQGGPDLGRYTGIQEVTADPFNGKGLYSDDPDGEWSALKLDYLLLNAHNVREFKTPSLRNVRFTAPYMHDGRFETLEEVVAFYSSLEGAAPRKTGEKLLVPLNLDEREQADLIEFLETLSSTTLDPTLLAPPPTPYLEE